MTDPTHVKSSPLANLALTKMAKMKKKNVSKRRDFIVLELPSTHSERVGVSCMGDFKKNCLRKMFLNHNHGNLWHTRSVLYDLPNLKHMMIMI